MLLIFFSAHERAALNQSCNLIGSWSELNNFLIRTARVSRAESVVLIYFRKRVSGNLQSFAVFTLPDTINKRKVISIYL